MHNAITLTSPVNATWQTLLDHLKHLSRKPRRIHADGSLLEAMRRAGREAIEKDETAVFRDDCCAGIILACLDAGLCTRDELIRTVPRYARVSYPYAAAFIDRVTGDDASFHLLKVSDEGKYAAHR